MGTERASHWLRSIACAAPSVSCPLRFEIRRLLTLLPNHHIAAIAAGLAGLAIRCPCTMTGKSSTPHNDGDESTLYSCLSCALER